MKRKLHFTPFVLAGLGLGCHGQAAGNFEQSERGTQCGPRLELEMVNMYSGDAAWVQTREGAAVLVNGDCTGTYVRTRTEPFFFVLTAGHCVALGDTVSVTLNFELDADGPERTLEGLVVEQSDAPDYALIAVEEDPQVEPTVLSHWPTDRLLLIQHPLGQPKVVAEGAYAGCVGPMMRYVDLDTLVGSSGAGVLNAFGRLVAVHTDGGCTRDGRGTNSGWSVASIVDASEVLTEADVDGS